MNRLSQAGARVFGTLVMLTAIGGCGHPDTGVMASQSDPPSSKIQVDELGNDNRLTVEVYDYTEKIQIDVSGLEVSIVCAKNYTWAANPDELRVELLRLGCAKITDPTPSADEAQAQDVAQNKKIGMWTESQPTTSRPAEPSDDGKNSPSSSTPTWLDNTISWLWSNWLALLGVIFAGLAVPGVLRWFKRRRYKKSVDIVLFGLSSAGKSDLWTAWAEGSAPKSNALPSSDIRRKTNLLPIVWSDYTLRPSVVDGVGGDPAGMLNSMRDVPHRHKRVLIFVIAPRRENTRNDLPIDERFVDEQIGYTSFPRALIGTKLHQLKPDLVVLFFSKFDLLSDAPPDDTSSKLIRDNLLTAFQVVTHAVERDCRLNHIPFEKVVGSSKHGWGIPDLQTRVTRLIFTGKGN